MGPSGESRSPFNFAGLVLALLLFLVFAGVVAGVLLTANQPPQLADPAATTPPQLFCDGTPIAAPDATSSPAPASVAPSGAEAGAPSTAPTVSATPLTPQPDKSPVPDCPQGKLAWGPQLRGGFDVNARLTALLAVITPFLTTVIAFYFGQKAGAGDGKAQGRADLAQEITVRAQGGDGTLQPLADEFARRGITRP